MTSPVKVTPTVSELMTASGIYTQIRTSSDPVTVVASAIAQAVAAERATCRCKNVKPDIVDFGDERPDRGNSADWDEIS